MNKTKNNAPEQHGHCSKGKRSKEYNAWASMVKRCTAPVTADHRRRYKERGIAICARWRNSFSAFLADIGNAPSKEFSLHRIDNDRGYEHGNVKWATMKEQSRAKSNNRIFHIGKLRLCLVELAELAGLDEGTIGARLSRGKDLRIALLTRRGAYREMSPDLMAAISADLELSNPLL